MNFKYITCKPVLESWFESVIENIKDSFVDLWDYVLSLDW